MSWLAINNEVSTSYFVIQVTKVQVKDKVPQFLVHYSGWNKTYFPPAALDTYVHCTSNESAQQSHDNRHTHHTTDGPSPLAYMQTLPHTTITCPLTLFTQFTAHTHTLIDGTSGSPSLEHSSTMMPTSKNKRSFSSNTQSELIKTEYY